MKVVVLGGNGMLGHRLVASLRGHEVHATFRGREAVAGHYGVDAHDLASVRRIITSLRPDAVINAIGLVKQRELASNAAECIAVNALFPHQLAAICGEVGARLVHISTDCVFAGTRGPYGEADVPDATDLYGRTKLLGEVDAAPAITLRTSMIGLELGSRVGLVEWFLAQHGIVKGYRQALFTGFTTHEIARVIERVLAAPARHGVYHLSSEPIDKYSLLLALRERLGRNIEIVADDSVVVDRRLDSTRFRRDFDYTPPAWPAMLDELAAQILERER